MATRRQAFVDPACAGDAELRAEIESLLAAHADERPLLEASPVAGVGQVIDDALAAADGVSPDLEHGTRIA